LFNVHLSFLLQEPKCGRPLEEMGVLRNVVIAILVLSLLTFIVLFGQLPALRKTPIGWLQRALCLHLPNGLRKVDRRVTGGKVDERSRRLGHYLFYEGNPVVLVWCFIDTKDSQRSPC